MVFCVNFNIVYVFCSFLVEKNCTIPNTSLHVTWTGKGETQVGGKFKNGRHLNAKN